LYTIIDNVGLLWMCQFAVLSQGHTIRTLRDYCYCVVSVIGFQDSLICRTKTKQKSTNKEKPIA